jgi:DNA mismatch repair protein MutS2
MMVAVDHKGRNPFAHAARALELPEVLSHIAARCRNQGAADAVNELVPTTDADVIDESLTEIMELCDYHLEHGRLTVADTSSQAWIGAAADKGDPIPAEALLDIAACERATAELVRSLENADGCDALAAVAAAAQPQLDLAADIERCIERDGSIKDKASKRLSALRRSVHAAREDLRRTCEKLAKSFGSVEYATYTGNRYMVLVPREKCKRREGLVHATSHSGGSLYFEPFSLVEKNNHLETVLLDERAEVARIIEELVAAVVVRAPVLLRNVRVVEHFDALDAKAGFAREFRCVRPAFSDHGTVRMSAARHPLLELSLREGASGDAGEGAAAPTRSALENDGPTGNVSSTRGTPSKPLHAPVPLDLLLERGARVLVITGPNAGGKTVTLKTVGLLTLMAQCGLPVPCEEGSELTVFHRVFADIGDEQSIASSLSTFTSHLGHLDAMCRHASEKSLCLVDEIGDGTDPDEGAALAIAALEHLLTSGAAVVATTHYGKVKTFALDTDGVSNASMLFDDDSDLPLYRLLQGTAGRSRGLDTAKRLDFVHDVIERAQELVGQETYELENLLAELESARVALDNERNRVAEREQALTALIESYSEKDRDLAEHRESYEARARREADEILLRARREIEAIVKEIRETQASKAAVREGHARLARLLDEVRVEESAVARPDRKQPRKVSDIHVGERVSLSPTGEPSGLVVALRGEKVTVDIRGKTINISKESLYKVETGDEAEARDVTVQVDVEPLRVTSVDVRGMDREEALAAVDQLMDRAVLNGVAEVKVIHGIGEEILLRAVREHLREDPRVASIREGRQGEGGRGVTAATLK